jgi:hypothetical protein
MKPTRRLVLGLFASSVVLLLPVSALADSGNIGFGFNARGISGVAPPPGAVTLTGGGAYNPDTGFVHSGGGFSCTGTVSGGPLNGCLAGEGVRWDTAGLLPGTMFRCVAGEALIPATTDEHTVVLQADFYRAGDGNVESFTAQMIVSDHDIDGGVPGVQNVWIQGVGCATDATVNFSSK